MSTAAAEAEAEAAAAATAAARTPAEEGTDGGEATADALQWPRRRRRRRRQHLPFRAGNVAAVRLPPSLRGLHL